MPSLKKEIFFHRRYYKLVLSLQIIKINVFIFPKQPKLALWEKKEDEENNITIW